MVQLPPFAQAAPIDRIDAYEPPPFRPDESRQLLREGFLKFAEALHAVVAASIDGTDDLFDLNDQVSNAEVTDFRDKRTLWLARFDLTIRQLFDRRLAGTQRKGRRPDFDASVATLRVLSAFDHEKQAALSAATDFLFRLTRREAAALDLRIAALLNEPGIRDGDNPLGPPYVLDAIGVASRAVYPNPRVWRPLMERVLADVTPAINKAYITVNRFLADRNVLPEIKAALRARSELRPANDSDLLPLFTRLLTEASDRDDLAALDVAVPAASPDSVFSPAPDASPRPPPGAVAVPASNSLAMAAAAAALNLALPAPAEVAPVPAGDSALFPQLDSLLALGSQSAMIATLDRWQRAVPIAAIGPDSPGEAANAALLNGAAESAPPGTAPIHIPQNLIPQIRAAIVGEIVNPTDRITMDVIGLLFDYIFRDPSIPDSLRDLFARLQVPILKSALLDHTFFTDKRHPARQLLDHLAAAAVGATGDRDYVDAFTRLATEEIDAICRDYRIDASVFLHADGRLREFMETDRRGADEALAGDVATALEAEHREADHAIVLGLMRDKLAGLTLPFEVRAFTETIWADYLTALRKEHGPEGATSIAAVQATDDLLWSITAKERTAQKARLTKLVPSLIRSLRAGCASLAVPKERADAFFESLYGLHIAAIKPKAPASTMPATPAPGAPAAASAEPMPAQPICEPSPASRIANVHDFVSEMVTGTWLAFRSDGETVNARLAWISPLRTKYIFTSRARARAFIETPEELAWKLGAGTASLVVEPVPMFERAVSAALDALAARMPAKGSAAIPGAVPA